MKHLSMITGLAMAFAAITSAHADITKHQLAPEEATAWGRLAISCFWPDGRFNRAEDVSAIAMDEPETFSILERYLSSSNRPRSGDRFRIIRAWWSGGILGTPYETDLVLHVKEGILSDEYQIDVLFNLIPPTASCQRARSFGAKP